MARGVWGKAAVALAAVGLLLVVHLWTVQQLGIARRASEPVSTKDALASAQTIAAGYHPAGTKLLGPPTSDPYSREVMLSLAGAALLAALALSMVVSIARGAARDGKDAAAASASILAGPSPELVRLAEQARRDVGDTVHTMRTPIATIKGYADMLKRALPPEDAKALRAVQAMEISAARLNHAVDEAWGKADTLVGLVGARREALDLCGLAKALAEEEELAHFVVGQAPAARYVIAPRTVLEDAVLTVFEVFAEDGSDGRCVASCASPSAATVSLTVRRDGAAQGERVDDVAMKRWPRLREVERQVALLGGQLRVAATKLSLEEIVLELPSREAG